MGAWAMLCLAAQRGLRNALSKVWRRMRRDRLKSAALSRITSHPFDEATGMDTAGLIDGSALATGHPHDACNVAYYGTAPSLFHAIVARWGGEPAAYTFVDLGCGKGRVVLLASEMGFRECIGVELNPGLAAVARRNVARWDRGRSPIRIECGDATEFDFQSGRCLLYLFHPFTGRVLERLLDRIEVVFARRPGELDLLYVNAEFREALEARAGFEQLWEMPVRMSAEDAAADLLYLPDATGNNAYGQDQCSGWRWRGEAEHRDYE